MALSKEKLQILKDESHNIKVVAGPGSGKTTLIIEKAYELVKKGVSPNKILIITYTNKAAEDIERKISKRIKEKGFYVSTFHGFCTRFMRENPNHFRKYTKEYRILEELSQLLFIVKFVNTQIKTEATQHIKPKDLRNYFGRIKDNYSMHEIQKIEHPIKESYLKYCQILDEQKRMDFGDLINVVSDTLLKDKTLHKIAQEKFDYIFVDEYQDINKNQENLLRLFLKPTTKLMVVGDKNQSIYGFRGSDIRIFESFENSFKNTKTYYLTKNYRSTWKIINISNKFMSLNDEKKIIGNSDKEDGKITPEGNKITVKEYPDDKIEAIETINLIKQLKENEKINNYSDVAILLRSVKGDSQRFIDVLEKLNIPYEVIGDGGLFELDYIKAILDCYKQLGEKDKITNEFIELELDRFDISDKISKGPLAIYYKIIEKSKYLQRAIRDNDEIILTNLGKFSKIISTYCENFNFDRNGEYLLTFYNNFSRIDIEFLDTEQPNMEYNNSVKILTLHKAKGLEFPLVIIPGVNKKKYSIKDDDFISVLFPYYDSDKDLERAFYVAMTRAKSKLIISYWENPKYYVENLMSGDIFGSKNNKDLIEYELNEEIRLESTEPDKETLELTYYKLIEFWKCPFAYKLRFHHDLLIPRTALLTYGSILHSVLYLINIAIKNKEVYDIDKIIEEKVPNWMQNKINNQMILRYLAEFKEELKNIVAIERPFEFSRGDSIITGRIDLLVKTKRGKYSIIEFKSGTWDEDKEKETKRQINLYALSQSEYDITEGIIYFFGSGGKKIPVEISKEQTTLDIDTAISEIQLGNFEKNTTKCKKCVFNEYPICPYNSSKNPNISIDSDEEDEEKRDFCCEL